MNRRLGARYNYEYNIVFTANQGTHTINITSFNPIENPATFKRMEEYISDTNNFEKVLIITCILVSKTRR